MKEQVLYRDLAKYYDLIYSWKDYAKETSELKRLFSKYKKSAGTMLLDVACGTGHHIKHLKDEGYNTLELEDKYNKAVHDLMIGQVSDSTGWTPWPGEIFGPGSSAVPFRTAAPGRETG